MSDQESPKVVGLVLGRHHKNASVVAKLLLKAKCPLDHHGCLKSDHRDFGRNCVLLNGVVSLLWHHSDLRGPKATLETTSGTKETLLSAIRSCRMEVLSNEALDISQVCT